ncbi:MAG: ABC transporter permease [Eubacteriales bacterium]
MGNYIVKRIFYAILTLMVVTTITFFLMYLVPGGPFLSEKAVSPATLAALKEKYGLDQPVPIQFKNYVVHLVQGDLGVSLKQRGRTVDQIIGTKFPVSAKIGGISVALALAVGIPLGSLAALHRGKWTDKVISVVSTVGIAIPSFVIATLLVMLLAIRLKLLPTFGLTTPATYIMPVLSLALYPTAYISRLMRSSMLDVLGQDYMRTARAKGLSPFVTLFKHALRNAILPVVTYLGPMLAYTLTGSFIIERIFVIPGLGNEFIKSITDRDYPLIMGTTIFLAFLLVSLNVIVDIFYKLIDPRIKYE